MCGHLRRGVVFARAQWDFANLTLPGDGHVKRYI